MVCFEQNGQLELKLLPPLQILVELNWNLYIDKPGAELGRTSFFYPECSIVHRKTTAVLS